MSIKLHPKITILYSIIYFYWVPMTRVVGHGFLQEPVPRTRLWLINAKLKPNYDNNGILCQVQSDRLAQCHECGWFGDTTETIIAGPSVNRNFTGRVLVTLTANHLGHFVFEMTPFGKAHYAKVTPPIPVTMGKNHYEIHLDPVLIPAACKHGSICTLRWTYIGGNNWGCDASGCGLAHGPQEVFRNCAEVV